MSGHLQKAAALDWSYINEATKELRFLFWTELVRRWTGLPFFQWAIPEKVGFGSNRSVDRACLGQRPVRLFWRQYFWNKPPSTRTTCPTGCWTVCIVPQAEQTIQVSDRTRQPNRSNETSQRQRQRDKLCSGSSRSGKPRFSDNKTPYLLGF